MKLHFPWNGLEKAFEELDTATKAEPKYNWETEKLEETGKGLWLVGDQGVYLMPNTRDGKYNRNRNCDKGDKLFVVYAKECDPEKLPDTWWDNKRASFGGDDGSEFIAIDEIKSLAIPPTPGAIPKYLTIDFKENQIVISIDWK